MVSNELGGNIHPPHLTELCYRCLNMSSWGPLLLINKLEERSALFCSALLACSFANSVMCSLQGQGED